MPFGKPEVAPVAKKKAEFFVKATNLAGGLTEATFRIALESWGITGITEVQIAPSRNGTPMALVKFKSENEAERMLQARGVQIEGKPLAVEPVRLAATASTKSRAAETAKGADAAPVWTTFIKVTGLPRETSNQEVVTFLRQYGVLGIVEANLSPESDHAIVEFQTADNVKSAIAKANGKLMNGAKVTLESHTQSARGSWTANGPIGAGPIGAGWNSSSAPAAAGAGEAGKPRSQQRPGPYDKPGQPSEGQKANNWAGEGGWGGWPRNGGDSKQWSS